MWTWSNCCAGLFLQTSNMSEKAVGYTTIGGDLEGALSVIANVPKTVVSYLLDYLLDNGDDLVQAQAHPLGNPDEGDPPKHIASKSALTGR